MQAVRIAAFQDRFARALLAAGQSGPPAFAVYRNTVIKGCIDALQANFPAVARLVGDEWFRAAAAVYARGHPPRVPMLLEYGEDFGAFLEAFEPAAEMPYLPAVAALDRCWTQAHIAADESVLDAGTLAVLDPAQLGALRLRPHAAARWAWFGLPAYSIWSRNREENPATSDIDWVGEGALLTRPGDSVRWMPLDAPACAFLDACARGEPLAQAAGSVPAASLAGLLASLLEAGAFATGEQQ
jgi:hypothetical protein